MESSIKEVIVQLLGKMKKGNSQEISSVWQEIVGKELAKHSRPVKIDESILKVIVDSPAVNFKIQNQKQQILDNLKKTLNQPIKDIHTFLGEL
jgi:hypothetical protein